jgi:hypothetical protein
MTSHTSRAVFILCVQVWQAEAQSPGSQIPAHRPFVSTWINFLSGGVLMTTYLIGRRSKDYRHVIEDQTLDYLGLTGLSQQWKSL